MLLSPEPLRCLCIFVREFLLILFIYIKKKIVRMINDHSFIPIAVCTTQEATVDRREILVNGDSRNCRKRKWQCVREQGTSRITCMLNGNGGGVIMQRSEVIAINYFR